MQGQSRDGKQRIEDEQAIQWQQRVDELGVGSIRVFPSAAVVRPAELVLHASASFRAVPGAFVRSWLWFAGSAAADEEEAGPQVFEDRR